MEDDAATLFEACAKYLPQASSDEIWQDMERNATPEDITWYQVIDLCLAPCPVHHVVEMTMAEAVRQASALVPSYGR